MSVPFIKMHAMGRDFILIDHRFMQYRFDTPRLCRRRSGIGCDTLVIMNDSSTTNCDIDIFKADGVAANVYGNAARCVAHVLMMEGDLEHVVVGVNHEILPCWSKGSNYVKVNMGTPKFKWEMVKMSIYCNTMHVPISIGPLNDPVAIRIMGHSHVIFFINDVSSIDLARYGPLVEQHDLFPEGINVVVAHVLNERKIKIRVWERGGIGETGDCSSAACAALVAASRRKLTTNQDVMVSLSGGDLLVTWQHESVSVTGPVQMVFTGVYDIQ